MTTLDASTLPFLDLYGPAFQSDPFGVLRELRADHWIARTPIGLAVLRHEPTQEVLAHRQLRTPGGDLLAIQGFTEGHLVDTMNAFLLNSHGADHDRVRRLVTKAFTSASAEAFRPRMRAIAEDLLDRLAPLGRCEFVADFAQPYAWQILCEYVGIPAGAQLEIQQWNTEISYMFGFNVADHLKEIESALANLDAFIDELVASRRRAPSDDLLSALIAAEETGSQLTPGELRAMVITLMAAGSGTSISQLGNAIDAFLSHPEQWAMLAAGEVPIAQAVEEVFRFVPASILGVPRVATADLVWRDLPLPAGTYLLPITGSANRDEQSFEEAETFDVRRKRRSHITFGGGIHACIGAALARAELQEALPILARRLADLAHDGPAEWRSPTEIVAGPARLPIRYAAR
ncbi:MAG TPA: cytochrome P450 [Herpetosiphonaceae bacterium]